MLPKPIFLTLISSLLLTSQYSYAAEKSSGFISGEKLISQFKGNNPYPAPNQNVGKALSIEFASGYLSGIIESTEGTIWCNKYGTMPNEIKADVQSYIEKLPEKQRQQEARVLIVKALKKNYPSCK